MVKLSLAIVLFLAASIDAQSQSEFSLIQPPIMLVEISAASSHSAKLDWTTLEDWPGTRFRIRWGKKSGVYTRAKQVGDVRTATVGGLAKGIWYFVVVRSYDNGDIHQKDVSNEVPWIVGH